MRQRGSVVVEYAGIVAVIALVMAGLLVLRPVHLGRRAPVRPIPALVRLIERPPVSVMPRIPARPRPPRPKRPRPSRPQPPGVLLPTWAAGSGG